MQRMNRLDQVKSWLGKPAYLDNCSKRRRKFTQLFS